MIESVMVVFQARIQEIRREAVEVKTFILTKPSDFVFHPGQYCWISLPGFEASPMAIASGTTQDTLAFSIRAWGELTHELFTKQVGDFIKVDGPHGTFFPVNRLNATNKVYMIAGGTGITPVRSLVFSLSGVKSIVYYGAKRPQELLYRDEIKDWPTDIYLTVDEPHDNWRGKVGLVTDLLVSAELDPNGLCFVCGPRAMEQATVGYLRERGITDSHIYVSLERFDEDGNVVGPVLPVTDPQVGF